MNDNFDNNRLTEITDAFLKFYKTRDYVLNFNHFGKNISTIIKNEFKQLN